MTSPFEQADFDQFDTGPSGLGPPPFCLTAVGRDDPRAVLDVLLPRREAGITTWSGARDRALEEFDDAGGSPLPAAVGRSGGWTWVWEANGFRGSLVRTMTRLSDLGRAVSVFRNGTALSSFVLAEERRVVRRFEPLRREDPAAVSVGTSLPDEALLDWDPEHCTSAAMTLLANLSGLYPEWPGESDEAFLYFN